MVNYKKPKGVAPTSSEILISINDLLTTQDNPVGEVQKVKLILLQYMSELKQIFRYYSQHIVQESEISRTTSRGRANTPALAQTNSLIKLLPWQQKTTADNSFAMSMVDFWKFAKDCHLPDARLSLAEIDRIFLLVDKHSNDKNDMETVLPQIIIRTTIIAVRNAPRDSSLCVLPETIGIGLCQRFLTVIVVFISD
jgi:hypothetical protein